MRKRLLAGLLAITVTFTGISFPGGVSAAQNDTAIVEEETTGTEETSEIAETGETTAEEENETEETIEKISETEVTEEGTETEATEETAATEEASATEETTETEVTEEAETEETTATEEATETETTEESSLASELSVTATNKFGSLFAEKFEKAAAQQEENNGCNVFSVEVTGTTAIVSFETTQDATLVVAVYDEDGNQMLASGKTEVTSGQTEADVAIDAGSIPQYFELRGYLIETQTLRPICTVYESSLYTQEMQEFLAKTTDDFDADKVLNLDDDTTNNFAVYGDDTIIIPSEEGKNIVTTADDSTNTYVIKNADTNLTSLAAGDTFSYEYAEGEFLIATIATINVDGTTVTITGEDDIEMEDVFSYVKIDAEDGLGNATIDDSTCEDGVTYEGLVDSNTEENRYNRISIGASMEKAVALKLDKKVGNDDNYFKISGGLNLKVTCSAKLYVTTSKQYVELKLDYSAKLSVVVTGKGEKTIPLVTIGFAFSGIIVELTPSLIVDAEASIEVSGTLKGTVGFEASPKGIKNLTSTPSFETVAKAEGTLYLGFSLEPRVKILSEKVASASLVAKVGAEVVATLSASQASQDAKHTCTACIDGDIYAKLDLEAGVELLNNPKWSFKLELLNLKEKIKDFYYSIDRDEFGWSTCPYWIYRIQVTVTDESGNPVEGAAIDGEYKTDKNGKAELWLTNGKHTLEIAKANYRGVCYSVDVDKKARKIKIKLKKATGGADIAVTEPVTAKDTKQILSLEFRNSGAIAKDGSLYMWGKNDYGKSGWGGVEGLASNPVKVLDNVVSVSLGWNHSGAITKDGSLYMWGWNEFGQLGDGTTEDRNMPVKVLDNVVSVSLGGNHSGAITKDGSLYMWGCNLYGELGDGTTEDKHIPVKVLDNVVSVSLGYDHSGVITSDGSLYMWGCNNYGQLGDGTTENGYTPVKIMDNVESVSLGFHYSSGAITSDGSLYMWGNNDVGQLGDGMTENRYMPVKVMDNVVSVSLGSYHSGAITSDGSLYMWGYNSYGQLGDGTTEYKRTPVKVMNNVVSISLGYLYSGAITSDGSLYMWGDNEYGQLGDGTIQNEKHIPTKINIPGGVALPSDLKFNESTQSGDFSVDSVTALDSAEQEITKEQDMEVISVLKADDVETNAATGTQTASFKNLTPNDTYNFYVAKSLSAEDLLASDNLLDIRQAVAGEDGRLTVTYAPRETDDNAVLFVVGSAQKDLSGAKITVNNATYSGMTKYVTAAVTCDGKTLVEGRDYLLTGGFEITAPGSYTLVITGTGTYTGTASVTYKVTCQHKYTEKVTKKATCTAAGTKTQTCSICGDTKTVSIAATGHKPASEWTVDKKATCTTEGSKSKHCTVCKAPTNVTVIPKIAHNYQNKKVTKRATTEKNGTLTSTCSVCGKKKIETIYAAKTVKLSKTSITYNGKNQKPSVTVTDANDKKLKSGTDYKVTYPKKSQNVGKYTVTIKLSGKYSGTVKKTFTVKPKNTSISKLTASKNTITVKWKKQTKQTTGYQIEYSTSSKFTKKTTKTVTISKNSTTSKKITKLKSNKTYYVRIRTYKTVKVNNKSTKIYSGWSKSQKIKTKKK